MEQQNNLQLIIEEFVAAYLGDHLIDQCLKPIVLILRQRRRGGVSASILCEVMGKLHSLV